jgi:hypothetical protein
LHLQLSLVLGFHAFHLSLQQLLLLVIGLSLLINQRPELFVACLEVVEALLQLLHLHVHLCVVLE